VTRIGTAVPIVSLAIVVLCHGRIVSKILLLANTRHELGIIRSLSGSRGIKHHKARSTDKERWGAPASVLLG
ncbi:MAG TPA: hypothetical protein PK867_27100, partial [Pirellulales bacterium]|nr:hypothetical protein [Pirellulales bacterium]